MAYPPWETHFSITWKEDSVKSEFNQTLASNTSIFAKVSSVMLFTDKKVSVGREIVLIHMNKRWICHILMWNRLMETDYTLWFWLCNRIFAIGQNDSFPMGNRMHMDVE